MNEAAALPSPAVLLSAPAQAVLRPPPTPSRPAPTSRLITGYRTRRSDRHSAGPPGRGGPPQFPPPPSERSTPSTPGSSSGLHSRLFTPSMAFAVTDRLGSPPPPEGGTLTTRQASLDAADRSVAPPTGLLTLGFDPARFQTEPPACYRASWQLPGPDSHRQATTSLCWITNSHHRPPTSGRTPSVVELRDGGPG